MNNEILILGSTGNLGSRVAQVFMNEFGVTYVDITSRNLLKEKENNKINFSVSINMKVLGYYKYIVNCIGVPKRKEKELGPIEAMEVNYIFPKKLINYCKVNKIKLIHVMTDSKLCGPLDEFKNCMVLRCQDNYNVDSFAHSLLNIVENNLYKPGVFSIGDIK
jgi:dTDP-4-dehydrorhamnose reductase